MIELISSVSLNISLDDLSACFNMYGGILLSSAFKLHSCIKSPITKSMLSSIINSGKFLLSFTFIVGLISSLFSLGEIIELRVETICCIVGRLLGSSDQHAN